MANVLLIITAWKEYAFVLQVILVEVKCQDRPISILFMSNVIGCI